MILKLRKEVKFHDGTAFDAEAVKFNIEDTKDDDQVALHQRSRADPERRRG